MLVGPCYFIYLRAMIITLQNNRSKFLSKIKEHTPWHICPLNTLGLLSCGPLDLFMNKFLNIKKIKWVFFLLIVKWIYYVVSSKLNRVLISHIICPLWSFSNNKTFFSSVNMTVRNVQTYGKGLFKVPLTIKRHPDHCHHHVSNQ